MRDFLYYLLRRDGRSYVVKNDVVTTQATPKPLEHTPDGWHDILVGYERNLSDSVGNLRNFTFPLGFVKEGAQILRHLVYTGNKEPVYLLIQRLDLEIDDTTHDFVHKYFYRGELDFSTFKDEEYKVSISVVESAIAKKLKANKGTTYEVPIGTDTEKILVKMDGLYFEQSSTWLVPGDTPSSNTIVPIGFVNKEGTSVYIATSSQQITDSANETFIITNTGAEAVTMQLTGEIKFVPNASPEVGRVKLFLGRYKAGSLMGFIQENEFDPVSTGVVYTQPYDLSIVLEKDEYINIQIQVFREISGATPATVTFIETRLKATYKTKGAISYIPALKPSTLGKRLMGKVVGDEAAITSTLFDSVSDIAISCGDAVRGIAGAKIKTSLQNYLEYKKVIHAAGHSVEKNKLTIEPFNYYLKTENPEPLGACKDFITTPANDLKCNVVKAGYEEQQIDNLNGKYAFCNTLSFTTPDIEAQKELSLICPYAADPFYIEVTRINFEGKTTTDSAADNKVMLLSVEQGTFTGQMSASATTQTITLSNAASIAPYLVSGSTFTLSGSTLNTSTFTVVLASVIPFINDVIIIVSEVVQDETASITLLSNVHALKRPSFDTLEGVPDPDTIFNIELSPKRILLKHQKWINSILWGFEGQSITFQTTEKNNLLKTIQGATVIDEDADVEIGTDRYFLPFYHEYDTEVPVDLVNTLEADQNTPFAPQWGGVEYAGILIKAGIAPSDNKEQTYKILSSPTNDLTKLITNG